MKSRGRGIKMFKILIWKNKKMVKSVSSFDSDGASTRKKKAGPKPKKKKQAPLTKESGTGKAGGPKGRRPKKKQDTFALYIYKVLKQVHPEVGVSRKAMSILNSFVNDCYDRITKEASILVKWMGKRTMSSRYLFVYWSITGRSKPLWNWTCQVSSPNMPSVRGTEQ